MKRSKIYSGILMGGASLILAACGVSSDQARGPELPDEQGIYALLGNDSDYQKIHGDRDWELKTWSQRSDLSPDVQFVVYHPALAADTRPIAQKVRLQKVGWLRSEIDGNGAIKPVSGSQWVVPTLDTLEVPVTVAPVEGRADAVHIVPRERPSPGLYSLQLLSTQTPIFSRVGVQWSSADKNQYSATNCIDRYVGSKTFYRSCGQQAQAIGELHTEELEIHLVEPEKRNVDGVETLIVKGVVVNTSAKLRNIPTMLAKIRNGEGATVQQWQFTPTVTELAPGKSVAFQTAMRRPPRETATVNVSFDPTATAVLSR